LLIAIEGQSRKLPEGKRFLLFLPEGEHHELGLLFASYLLKQKGHDVVYLGQSTPLDNLKTVFKKWQPQVLFTIITSPTLAIPATELITVIGEMWPECELWITGDKVLNNNLGSIPSNTKLVQDFSHFRQMMINLRVSTEQ
jgi:hypothetical protein